MRSRYLFLILCALSLPLISGYSMGEEMGGFFPSIPSEFMGDNISFSFDPTGWCVEDVKVYGTEIVDKMCLPQEYAWSFENHGFSIRTKGYEFSIGNFSEPSMVYKSAEKGSIEIVLCDDVSVDEDNLVIEKGNVFGQIISDGQVDINGHSLLISFDKEGVFQIRFYLKSPSESIPSQSSFKDALSDAFKLKKIGAEVRIEMGEFSTVSYNDIRVEPVEIGEKRAVLTVSSNETEGKCIYMHLDMNISEPRVILDGSEIREGSYYDALFSTGNEAVWNITVTDGERSLMVYIPHFSSHTLVVEESYPQSSGHSTNNHISYVLPLMLAILISSVATAALIVRKRKP